MSLISEKKEAIALVERLDNIETIRLIKNILIKQQEHIEENALEHSIKVGLSQSSSDEVVLHEDVMHFFKRKYK